MGRVYSKIVAKALVIQTCFKRHDQFFESQAECQQYAVTLEHPAYQWRAHSGRKANCKTVNPTTWQTCEKVGVWESWHSSVYAATTTTTTTTTKAPIPDYPLCLDCGDRPQECWRTCGGEGLCDKCNSPRGTMGACCKPGSLSGDCSLASTYEFTYPDGDYHQCALVTDEVGFKKLATDSICQGARWGVEFGSKKLHGFSLLECMAAVKADRMCGYEDKPFMGYGEIRKRFEWSPHHGGECVCAKRGNDCIQQNPAHNYLKWSDTPRAVYSVTIPDTRCEDRSVNCEFIKSLGGCNKWGSGGTRSTFDDVNDGKCDVTCNRCVPPCLDETNCEAWCEDKVVKDGNGEPALDRIGKNCKFYKKYPSNCGKWDDSDFKSTEDCCACTITKDRKMKRGGTQVKPKTTTKPPKDGDRKAGNGYEQAWRETGCPNLPPKSWSGWGWFDRNQHKMHRDMYESYCQGLTENTGEQYPSGYSREYRLELCCGSNLQNPNCGRTCSKHQFERDSR